MSRAAGRVKENYLLLERVSDRIKMGADVYLASHVADHCDCLENSLKRRKLHSPLRLQTERVGTQVSPCQPAHVALGARALAHEAIRMHVAQGMAYSQVQGDPLLQLVRHVEQEDRDRVFAALRALVPKVERIVAQDNLTRSLKSRFGPDTAVGTAVSIPELCHDRLHRCQRPADSEVGCKDDAFYSQIHSSAPFGLLSVIVMPSFTEKRCIIGAIVLPIAVPLDAGQARRSSSWRSSGCTSMRPRSRCARASHRIGRPRRHDDAVSVRHPAGRRQRQSRPRRGGALPFVYRAERSFQDKNALLHTLLRQPLASNRHDPALRHLSSAPEEHEQLREARGGAGPGRGNGRRRRGLRGERQLPVRRDGAIVAAAASCARLKNGSLSDVTYFASASKTSERRDILFSSP